MDRIFDGNKARVYESWLGSRAGHNYVSASCGLLDRLLDCRPGWRVLDVGCGTGVHLEHLREQRLMTYGLESSPLLKLAASQKLGERTEITLGDACNLPYSDNSFDAVIMVNTLEYLDRPALALAEAARVSSGRLCVITFNAYALNRFWLNRSMRPLQFMGLWRLTGLLRQVLGQAPFSWASASLSSRPVIGKMPLMGLIGVCMAVTPRFMTTPLTLEIDSAINALSPSKAVTLRVVK